MCGALFFTEQSPIAPDRPILVAMSYLDDHLLAGERIVYRAHLHWIIFGTATLVILAGVALTIVLKLYQPEYWYLGAALAGIGLLLAIPPAIRYTSSEFAVTDKRVLAKHGFIQRESIETLLSKVEAIEVDQGVIGRVMGFGSISITGTGGTEESFPMISSPLEFRRQIQSQIVEQEERRGLPRSEGMSAEAAGGRVERECPFCAEPILARARVCKHCGRDVVPVAG
jgi:membrane protein YdbS with pleckstrin-like domain